MVPAGGGPKICRLQSQPKAPKQTIWLSASNTGRGGGGGGGGLSKGGRGVWHEAMVLVCLLLAAPIGLSPLHIPTLCGPERVLVVSTEPPDDLSCLTTPGSAQGGLGGTPPSSYGVRPF